MKYIKKIVVNVLYLYFDYTFLNLGICNKVAIEKLIKYTVSIPLKLNYRQSGLQVCNLEISTQIL